MGERGSWRRYDSREVVETVRKAARQVPGQAVGHAADAGRAIAAGGVEGAAGERAVFSRADVAGQVAARLPVDGRSAAGVMALVEELTDRGLALDNAVPVGRHPQGRTPRASDARWAGAAVLAAEGRILSLAGRGRAAGYGQVPTSTLIVAMTEARLDLSQHQAISALAAGGDFLSVLTAPAGAGKTRTLGVAAAAWQRAGYRVIGLAPSARAAAELAAATGGPADTLAKWIHDHHRRGLLPADARARVVMDAGTVVVLDEASMANTHDLDVLVTAAARAAAKVVLVGDPAQIGVINGPGGMLAALAAAGHGVELAGVHRFSQDWERDASLALRRGDPDVLTVYQGKDRLHACAGADEALTAVHARWEVERAAGRDVLMMARTRADVDALNHRARESARATGEVHGAMVPIGERKWGTGDLVRTRRNDRTLGAGDGHVRNGDRWRVLAVEDAGLLVEHLDRGDRTLLPADYVAVHAEYGWASTIDAAQGATVDVGLVLVRPGIDREHLYVALTRGRDANHAYITPDPATDVEDRHGLPPVGRSGMTSDERALDVLTTALMSSGVQDAAHTARDNARARAVEQARRAAEQVVRRAAEPVVPADHVARAAQLTQCQQKRADLGREQSEHRYHAAAARADLAGTSRLRPGRRRDFADTIETHERALQAAFPDAVLLDREIENLTRLVNADTRQREQEHSRRRPRAERDRANSLETYLAPAASVESASRALGRARRALARAVAQDPYRAPEPSRHSAPDRARERGRDDSPGIGW